MKSLFSYLTESQNSPTSDNAIWYLLGLHKYKWSKPSHERWNKKYDISQSDPRPGIIRMAKDLLVKPLKSNQEVISRSDWDLNGLIGESEKQLLHPDYWTMQQYIYDEKGNMVYNDSLDYCPYKIDFYEHGRWNDNDGNYDLLNGYKLVVN